MNKAMRYWALALASLMAGSAWLCADAVCQMPAFDRAGLTLAHGLQTPLLDTFMHAVTWLGSLWLLLPLALLGSLLLGLRGHRREAWFLLLSLVVASLLSHLFKVAVARPRPDLFPMLVDLPPDWSYPSAHTMQAMAAALAVVVLWRQAAPAWWALALLGAGLVGWSRIHLQVHFPSDVVFGALAALFWVLGLRAALFGPTARAFGMYTGDRP